MYVIVSTIHLFLQSQCVCTDFMQIILQSLLFIYCVCISAIHNKSLGDLHYIIV